MLWETGWKGGLSIFQGTKWEFNFQWIPKYVSDLGSTSLLLGSRIWLFQQHYWGQRIYLTHWTISRSKAPSILVKGGIATREGEKWQIKANLSRPHHHLHHQRVSAVTASTWCPGWRGLCFYAQSLSHVGFCCVDIKNEDSTAATSVMSQKY